MPPKKNADLSEKRENKYQRKVTERQLTERQLKLAKEVPLTDENQKERTLKKTLERETKKVDKENSILDHLAYLLQGNGECTAVFHDHKHNKLIIAANSITSSTNKKMGLYQHITEILAFFNDKAQNSTDQNSENLRIFLQITKQLLNGLQQEDPYKSLSKQSDKDSLDKFIQDFVNKTGPAKDFAKNINYLKKTYSNDVAQQISKVG